jgi:hypothetical protein
LEVDTQTMMKRTLKSSPKVAQQGEGVGVPSPRDIERRAKELARIAGRRVTDEDRAQARAEFQDRTLPAAINEDAESMQSMSRDPSDPMVDRGRQTPEYVEGDEKTDLEKITLEGVEEAQHDQMVSARRGGKSQPPSGRRSGK